MSNNELNENYYTSTISRKNTFLSKYTSNEVYLTKIKHPIDNCLFIERNGFKDPELPEIYPEKHELNDNDNNHTDKTYTSEQNNISEPLFQKKKTKTCIERLFGTLRV
jgi:hypothetical protein